MKPETDKDFFDKFYAHYWEQEVETPNEDMEEIFDEKTCKKYAEEGYGLRKDWIEFPERVKNELRKHIDFIIISKKITEWQVDEMQKVGKN